MNATTTANKTIKVTHIDPEQKVIRCVARVDMPDYDIKAGQVFFLSRASEVDTFYIVVWNKEQNKWACGHPARANAKPCTHVQAVSTHCHDRAEREKAARLAASKPPIPLAERGALNGNRGFSLLKKAS